MSQGTSHFKYVHFIRKNSYQTIEAFEVEVNLELESMIKKGHDINNVKVVPVSDLEGETVMAVIVYSVYK